MFSLIPCQSQLVQMYLLYVVVYNSPGYSQTYIQSPIQEAVEEL